jgi:bacterioferritin-associated ferredoxin
MNPPSVPRTRTGIEAAPATYLCHCLKVTHDQVRDAIAFHGCETVEDVTSVCSAGGGCTCCHHKIRAYLAKR